MAEEKKDGAAAKPAKKTDVMMLVILVFAVVNLICVGIGANLVYKSTLGWHAPSISEHDLKALASSGLGEFESKEPLIYTMDKLTVNLSGQPPRMIRVEVNVEMLAPDGFEEVIDPDNQAKVRDQIIELLNNRNFDEVESLQGKLFLKDEIAQRINKTLDRGVVKDVFFSEFVVQ